VRPRDSGLVETKLKTQHLSRIGLVVTKPAWDAHHSIKFFPAKGLGSSVRLPL